VGAGVEAVRVEVVDEGEREAAIVVVAEVWPE
jgi:hypothetical protein